MGERGAIPALPMRAPALGVPSHQAAGLCLRFLQGQAVSGGQQSQEGRRGAGSLAGRWTQSRSVLISNPSLQPLISSESFPEAGE